MGANVRIVKQGSQADGIGLALFDDLCDVFRLSCTAACDDGMETDSATLRVNSMSNPSPVPSW